MAEYRYYTTDLRGGAFLNDLPLYGVFMNKRLNASGDFTGTFRLDTGMYIDSHLLDSSIPGRTAIYVERDGTIIWGGIIWSRTYNAQGKNIQLTAQTFESYFDHIVIDQHFIQQNVEQTTIFSSLIDAMQGQLGGNIGLTKDVFPATGITREVLVPGYEYRFAQTVVEELVGTESGFDYRIDVIPGGQQDNPTKIVRVGYPEIGQTAANSNLHFDYPGNIDNYWWPESATRSGTVVGVLGHGSGYEMVRATATDGNKIASGYPSWWVVNSYKMVMNRDEAAQRAVQDLNKYVTPVIKPTFQVKSDLSPDFSGWSALGDAFTCYIEDARFPGGKSVVSRMIGWELSPADSNSTEMLKLVIEGQEE